MGSSFRFLMRGCAIFMAFAAVLIVVVYGITLWSLLGAAILLACPVYVLWSAARVDAEAQRDLDHPSQRRPS